MSGAALEENTEQRRLEREAQRRHTQEHAKQAYQVGLWEAHAAACRALQAAQALLPAAETAPVVVSCGPQGCR